MKGGLTAVLMTMIIAFAGALPAQDVKGPTIVAKEVNHDFGKVVQGKQVSYVFEIRNAGTEPLIIDRVVPS